MSTTPTTKDRVLAALRANPNGLQFHDIAAAVPGVPARTITKSLLRLRVGELADKVRESAAGRRGAAWRWFAVEQREDALRASEEHSRKVRAAAKAAYKRPPPVPYVPTRRVVEQSEPVRFFGAHRPGVYVIASGSCVARAYGERTQEVRLAGQ